MKLYFVEDVMYSSSDHGVNLITYALEKEIVRIDEQCNVEFINPGCEKLHQDLLVQKGWASIYSCLDIRLLTVVGHLKLRLESPEVKV